MIEIVTVWAFLVCTIDGHNAFGKFEPGAIQDAPCGVYSMWRSSTTGGKSTPLPGVYWTEEKCLERLHGWERMRAKHNYVISVFGKCISATIEGRNSMLSTIRAVAEEIYIPFTVGGGIRTIENMTTIIKAGAEKISINSAAISDPNLITKGAKKFGSQCIVVSIDAKRKGKSWEVYSHGGTKPTGLDVIEWAKIAVEKGAGELLVTSMDRDGTNIGYDLDLIRKITDIVSVPMIASGGAGTKEHFLEAINNGAEAILAASLFHYKKLEIQDLKEFLDDHDIQVRL